jgi:2'-5' RNA ligase
MRLFLAFDIAPDVRARVTEMQERLKQTGADVKWVEPVNFHLTVKFIGDITDTLLPEVEAGAQELAAFEGAKAFRFRVFGGSFFPKRGPQIKTLFAGVTSGANEWKVIAGQAQEVFAPLGVPKEGNLAPHVTLGRVRSQRNMDDLRQAVQTEAETDCGEQAASELVLVQSTLDPRGATYKEVRRWPLRPASEERRP